MDAVRRIDQVIDKLVEIRDIRAVEPLIKLAKRREAFRSASAIEALGNFDDKKSIDYLVKSLKDKDKDIRRIAADALDKLEWEPE
jgi:HEAT repeat protein